VRTRTVLIWTSQLRNLQTDGIGPGERCGTAASRQKRRRRCGMAAVGRRRRRGMAALGRRKARKGSVGLEEEEACCHYHHQIDV